MASCDVCGKASDHVRCDLKNDRKWKCEQCYYEAHMPDDYGVTDVMGWEPWTIEHGPMDKLPKTWPGRYYEDGRFKVKFHSKEHEKETLREMGCHIAERGEVVGGHDFQFKGRPKLNSKTTVFLGTNRKASTCR